MVTAPVRIDLYRLIDEAVQRGINTGWYRAHKHTDHPDEFYIKSKICEEVLNAICEYISFSEGANEG